MSRAMQVNILLYSFFWVIPRCLNFKFRRFGTFCNFHLPPMKMELKECSETSAHKIKTPGYYLKERIQHSEYGESSKSRTILLLLLLLLLLPLPLIPLILPAPHYYYYYYRCYYYYFYCYHSYY
jgi:hypothetical protein